MWGGMIYKYSESQHTTISNLRFKTYLVNLDSVAFQVVLVVKNLLDNANAGDVRDTGLIPGLGRSPGGGHNNPLQYSCLENPMVRGAWWAAVHRVTHSRTQLKPTRNEARPLQTSAERCSHSHLNSPGWQKVSVSSELLWSLRLKSSPG